MARKQKPAYDPAARENQLIALAYDEAEKRLLNGTASNTLITQLLKAGSSKERLEKENLKEEVKLKIAKTEAMEAAAHMEESYTKAIEAMRKYQGRGGVQDVDEEL